ncbi:Zn-dependent exopeptidase [Imleria badia]|nr:Zn-dependent exopeptidase [Imleria badia]
MDEKRTGAGDTKSALDTGHVIPPPATQRRYLQPRSGSWTRLVILSLVVLSFFWAKSRFPSCATHVLDGRYDTLIREYMKHGNRRPNGPLRGSKAEELFLTVPNEQSALAASRLYASKPHLAGTPGDLETAKDFLVHLQQELGINHASEVPIYSAGSDEAHAATLNISAYTEPTAWLNTYYPVLNSPVNHSLEILGEDGNPIWTAELEEVSDGTDPDAAEYAKAVLTWHGISRGGEAQGKLVYVNYGRKKDYDALVEVGTDFDGKIVLARYGNNFRGLKVKRAQELGAAAVLIYSDPRDDGTVTTENGYLPYPHGPARNPTSVQRGSVQFLSLYPGDPSTPGYPAYENSTRVDGDSKPRIPSLPISWSNAKVLLDQIADGKEGPTVRLVNNVEEKITPIWNTFGVIPGHIKDEVVVLGASDPSSGTVSVHEAIRGFGTLLRNGWKPLRTILIASWDGEEYGLVGSTEWGEDFADWIRKHVVAYINMDTSVSGSHLRASASPLLAHLLRSTAQQIPHPTAEGRSLWDARLDEGEFFGEKLDAEAAAIYKEMESAADNLGVKPLGSGSDYTVFLQYIGVASAEAGFSSTLHDPVYHYHSVFDSQHWQEVYGDPTFSRHVAIAKHIGLQVLHLSGDIILPFNTTHYSLELQSYLDRVEQLTVTSSLEVDLTSLHQSIQALQAASVRLDTEKAEAEVKLRTILRKMKKRQALMRKLYRKSSKWICKLAKYIGNECEVPEDEQPTDFVFPRRLLLNAIKRVQAVNDKLIAFERGFISKEGLKDREWYKHLGVAPGKWLGYGATTLPGITEAITLDGDAVAAGREVERLKIYIDNLTERISF